jgi:hypothetical protein
MPTEGTMHEYRKSGKKIKKLKDIWFLIFFFLSNFSSQNVAARPSQYNNTHAYTAKTYTNNEHAHHHIPRV